MSQGSSNEAMNRLAGLTVPDRLVDNAYARLREAILSGDLPPGTRLSVPALAKRLEISRSPIREAVLRLTREQLAEEVPHRGVVVARIGPRDLAALYEVREVLEGLAARLAVENAGRRLVDQLATALADQERAVETGDMDGHVEADMRFHSLYRRASGNPDVLRLLDELQVRVRLAMLTTAVAGGPHKALEDHRTIFRAIESGDPAGAELAARAHIARLRKTLEEQGDETTRR